MDNPESLDRSSIDEPIPANGDNSFAAELPHNTDHEPVQHQIPPVSDGTAQAFDSVIHSDSGVNILLTRLKQSIASVRDFAAFLKKRSTLEEEHATGLKKLCRSTHESLRRPDNKQGSYAQNYDETNRVHDRMADNGIQFALSLHQMHEDLQELATEKERGRKQWKQSGLSAEKRVQESESAMEKAKHKYDSLAEDYDRARTGDRQSGRVFGLKGPKSAAQVEEDLHRKVQAADADYSSRVQAAQGQRQELIRALRPQALKAIQDLIHECDSGLTLQMQKFASFNEKLLLSNGLCVSPLKGQENHGNQPRSLRDIVYQIDNERDLRNYVASFAPKIGSKPADIEYHRHPTLLPSQQLPPSANRQPQVQNQIHQVPPPQQFPQQYNAPEGQQMHNAPLYDPARGPSPNEGAPPPVEKGHSDLPQQPQQYMPNPTVMPHMPTQNAPAQFPQSAYSSPGANSPVGPNGNQTTEKLLPPSRPVFGVSLDDLFQRDGTAVPMVVYQCIQAVDLFGLEVEGIYRLSGTASHVTKMRSIFDNDSSKVDFRNPENFYHDVNSVAGLLKQFFRDLPDPLLTKEHYQGFVEAARIDDDITRRDSLHATINSLPDPNYATLRALTLHLNRVQEHSGANRMNAGNLAICFGPTLMGSNSGPNIADAGWQVRVIDTILQNTYQIFDDD